MKAFCKVPLLIINGLMQEFPHCDLTDAQLAEAAGMLGDQRKSIGKAYVLCVLIGPFGAHKFYLNSFVVGAIYLGITATALYWHFFAVLLIPAIVFDLATLSKQVQTANEKIGRSILEKVKAGKQER